MRSGEDGELGELRHARHHEEADFGDIDLELAVEGRHALADGLGLDRVVDDVADGRVILVDEDDDRLAVSCGERAKGTAEVLGRGSRVVVHDFNLRESCLDTRDKLPLKGFQTGSVHRPEVKVQHGIDVRPIVIRLRDVQPLEKLPPTLENRLERGEHERLPEPPRPGDEEKVVAADVGDQRVEGLGLVHVNAPIPAQRREIVSRLVDWFGHGLLLFSQYSKAPHPASVSGTHDNHVRGTSPDTIGKQTHLCAFHRAHWAGGVVDNFGSAAEPGRISP